MTRSAEDDRLDEIRDRYTPFGDDLSREENDIKFLYTALDGALSILQSEREQAREVAKNSRAKSKQLEEFTSLAVGLEDKARLERANAEWWDKGSPAHTACIRVAEGYEDRAKEIYDILGLD